MKKTTFSLSAAIGALAVLASSSATHAAPATGSKPAKSYFLYVGSYTRVTGKGIYGYRFNPGHRRVHAAGPDPGSGQPRLDQRDAGPSLHLRLQRRAREGELHDQRLRPGCENGVLTASEHCPLQGRRACADGRRQNRQGARRRQLRQRGVPLPSSSYSGSARWTLGEAVSRFAEDGVAGAAAVPRDANGNSPTDTHDHCIMRSPDSRFVLVCNLGLGKVYIYRLNSRPACWSGTASHSSCPARPAASPGLTI